MKAIQIARTGGPEVLDYVDLPTPVPGGGDVLVKAHAIGVNMPEAARAQALLESGRVMGKLVLRP